MRVACRRLIVALALACAAGTLTARAQAPDRKPKLIVLLMVDQMRGDYVDKFRTQWTGGLHRLLSSGAWFRQVDYPYFDTVTCAGHTTVASGTLPWTHGMVMNSWWDRGRQAEVPCTQDRAVTPVSYGNAVTSPGDSAAAIRVPTLADELREQLSPSARVISFSMKARAAIPMGGRAPDAVTWFDDSGTWVTSSAFVKSPVPAVAEFIQRHPIASDFDKVWDRSLPLSAYLYAATAAGANILPGRSAAFPHSLKDSSHAPDQEYYDRWQDSPFSDDYLGDMAVDVASRMRLGQGTGPDMIAVSFSALDRVGHDFGPNSQEVQDVLVRLDRTLDRLFSGLDRLAGAGNYVVALSGDHGVAPLPEWLQQYGIDSGRIAARTLERAVETTLFDRLGAGTYVERVLNGNIYLAGGVFDRLTASPTLLEAVRRSLGQVPGVQAVLTRDQVAAGAGTGDNERRLSRSYDAGRSGDLFVVTAPYWSIRANGTGHGSPHGYDTRVPILLMGKGITPGEYLQAASPVDIAPTLAFLAGITLPQSEGRVLTEAIASEFTSPRRDDPKTVTSAH